MADSKSVRSYKSKYDLSYESKKNKLKLVKNRINDILYSVKEEKEHIEKRMHENEKEIEQLREEYQLLKYDHDFDNLSKNEQIILKELVDGLDEVSIDSSDIFGRSADPFKSNSHFKELTSEEIVTIQKIVMERLASKLIN